MSLFDKIRGEFVDIVEWLDPTQDTLAYRFEPGADDDGITAAVPLALTLRGIGRGRA